MPESDWTATASLLPPSLGPFLASQASPLVTAASVSGLSSSAMGPLPPMVEPAGILSLQTDHGNRERGQCERKK